MDTSALQNQLHDHIVDEILLRDEPLQPHDDLFDAGFDSMSLSRILVFIEEQFGVVIPDEDVVLDNISTLQLMTDFVAGYLNQT
ncbi:MAG TPA: acyl carrier protein [Sorangium sp.]|nr:acyl carrier protein [Sorangium sp.]